MTQPPDSRPKEMPPAATPRGQERQDTLLLSEVPDPAALLNDTVFQPAPGLNLGTANLAALSERYDILAEAGHGNMGNVYKARDRETGEVVALKLLKPEIASDQAMMERFKNELLFARKITHKNVCRVHEFNRIGGIAYTSMEFVEGESLRSVLNRFGGLPLRKAINVALQICSGLKEAHAQGIVHRDLKPENVMIDANGNVKIMDFGIARSMEAATRLTGSMIGTPAYMAPEQVSGKQVDYRTDIYSLGLILYEMFTGTQAFQADTPVAVALKQIRETPPPPHEVEPNVPVAIERAILKCLEKEQSRRYQSVAELEKVLGAPSATGTSAGLAPFATPAPVSAVTPAPRAVLSAPPPKSSRVSPIVWLLVGAAAVFGGLSAAHWAKVAKSAEQIPAPAAIAAPKPPDFALTLPAATDSSAPTSAPAAAESSAAKQPEKKAPSKPAAAKPQPSTHSTVFPPVELPGKKKSARQQELEGTTPAPPAVQERADKAFSEGIPKDAQANTYLWVGRYQRQDKANEVVTKIRGFGLPVRAIQRTGLTGQFWVVVTGPYTAKRVSDVTQWLEAQGYRNVHEFELPGTRNPTEKPRWW
ncbi:MAG TPA: protein kinase [Candidatus Limnocylindrales bacterium]|nr:protein kinase [Candidatus Limnocylindrales bacterium]